MPPAKKAQPASADPDGRESIAPESIDATTEVESDETAALRAQVEELKALLAGQRAPEASAEPAEDKPLCAEHFPDGWESEAVRRADEVTGMRQSRFSCEHGAYDRPAA